MTPDMLRIARSVSWQRSKLKNVRIRVAIVQQKMGRSIVAIIARALASNHLSRVSPSWLRLRGEFQIAFKKLACSCPL
jgi:hypothetical protein